ncbi:MAG: M67 family metallopeptidase [Pseudomonadota bacterium]|nr:M67 family metallopeptidase [Pseudomonadota bacterium]
MSTTTGSERDFGANDARAVVPGPAAAAVEAPSDFPVKSVGTLQLSEALRGDLEAMVCRGYPNETCGLLVGHQREGIVEVIDLIQARNLNRTRARDRYELDPRDFVAADSAARGRGMEIVGIWHSHPDHPARPSATDRAGAWAGWSYLIASVTERRVAELRSWRLNGTDFCEEAIAS